MKARRKVPSAGLPNQGSDATRRTHPRDARRGLPRTRSRMARERSRSMVSPQAAVQAAGDIGVDWETLPVSLVLDSDFDLADEEGILGHARSMAATIRDEEDWLSM